MASTVRAAGSSVGEMVRYAVRVALGFGLALALAYVMLIAAGPASAESIPQNSLIDDILKLNNIKLIRRDDRLGIGNLVVKHPPALKAEKDDPNYESWGTAWLIGECHIMTARHVIDPDDPDVKTNELPMKSSIQFVIGPVRDQTKVQKANDISKLPEILDSSKATPVAWGQYQFPKDDDPAGKRKAEWENYYEDWALLKLDKCLGQGSQGYIPLAVEGISTEEMLKRTDPLPARGPPVSGISHLVDDDDCHLYGQVELPLWNSDCFARPGSSGSPILTPDGNGGWKAVAILVRGPSGGSIRNELLEGARPKGWPWRVQYMELGNPVSGFLDRIRPLLKDDKGVRLSGVGTNKPYAEKDEGMVSELEKQRAERPDDMPLAVRWIIALHNARGAEPALTEIDKLLEAHADSRELRSVRIDIVGEDSLYHSTAWKKAVDDMATFRGMFPEMNELQYIQGFLLAQGGECKNAANLFRKSWDKLGINPDIRMDWTDAMACAGEHRAALSGYDEMLRYTKKYWHPRFMRALVRFRIGQSEPARADLRKIIEVDPNNDWAKLAAMQRAVFAMNEGHHLEEAEKDLRKAMTETDDNPGPGIALGAGLLAQNRDADAVEVLKAAHKNKKEDIESALMLTIALTKAGKAEEAKAVLKDLIQPHDDPNHWEVQLVKVFQGDMTADDFLKAAEAGPEDTKWTRVGIAHAYVGLLAYAKGDVKGARRYFETSPYLDRTWLEYSLIDAWRRAADGEG